MSKRAEPIAKTPWLTYRNGRWGVLGAEVWLDTYMMREVFPEVYEARHDGQQVRLLFFRRDKWNRKGVGFWLSQEGIFDEWVCDGHGGPVMPGMIEFVNKHCSNEHGRSIEIQVK